jgi:hypothetical protein
MFCAIEQPIQRRQREPGLIATKATVSVSTAVTAVRTARPITEVGRPMTPTAFLADGLGLEFSHPNRGLSDPGDNDEGDESVDDEPDNDVDLQERKVWWC